MDACRGRADLSAARRPARFRPALLIAAAGIWATAAGAAPHWTDISPPLAAAPLHIGLVDSDPELVFLGTWGDGLYRSADAGATWTRIHDDFFIDDGIATDAVVDVMFDDLGQRGVAITFAGAYVSSDGGRSWRRHEANRNGNCPRTGHQLARIPDGSGVVASELWGPGYSGAAWIYEWESDTWRVAGASLLELEGESTLGVDFDAGTPPTLYICNTFRNLYTEDLGTTLRGNSAGLPSSGSRVIVCDPEVPGRVLVAVDRQLYLQVSRGAPWVPYAEPMPSTIHALIHAPDDPDRMFVATSSGVLESRDRGASWILLDGTALPYEKAIDVRIHPLKPAELLVAVATPEPTGGALFRLFIDEVSAEPGVRVGTIATDRCRLRATPNPAGAGMEVAFVTPVPLSARELRLEVYDVRGRRVRSVGTLSAAAADVGPFRWDGRDEGGSAVPSGVYVLRLSTVDGTLATERVTIQR